MKQNLTCMDCGGSYNYDSDNARGASADRCARCRKKETARKWIYHLMGLASKGNPECRKCGYKKSVYGLSLIPGRVYLHAATDQPAEENRALQGFLLCKNCEAECDKGLFEVKIIDLSVTPIKVEFYEKNVREISIKPFVEYSEDAQEFEIVDKYENERSETMRTVTGSTPKSLPEGQFVYGGIKDGV